MIYKIKKGTKITRYNLDNTIDYYFLEEDFMTVIEPRQGWKHFEWKGDETYPAWDVKQCNVYESVGHGWYNSLTHMSEGNE